VSGGIGKAELESRPALVMLRRCGDGSRIGIGVRWERGEGRGVEGRRQMEWNGAWNPSAK
jgi:hypothetical protein